MDKIWSRTGAFFEGTRKRKLERFNKNKVIDSLIHPSDWVALPVGTPAGSYPEGWRSLNGGGHENLIEARELPDGEQGLVWVARTDGKYDQSGGFISKFVSVDAHRTYRISVWVKKKGTAAGTTYVGLYARNEAGTGIKIKDHLGAATGNFYLYLSDTPEDVWTLVYGYIRPVDSPNFTRKGKTVERFGTNEGDTYKDGKFLSGTDTLAMRVYDFYDSVVGNELEIWQPRLDLVGDCPSIDDLTGKGIW